MGKSKEKLSGPLHKGLHMVFNHRKPLTSSLTRTITGSFLRLPSRPRSELRLQVVFLGVHPCIIGLQVEIYVSSKEFPSLPSAGQVVWAPRGLHLYLVFVGWPSNSDPKQDARKLGIKYCYNRPYALCAVRVPFMNLKLINLKSKMMQLKI